MIEYIVQPGDTLQSIARLFKIPTRRLVSINPSLYNSASLEAGETLLIPSSAEIRQVVEVNGFVELTTPETPELQKTLTFLTYLSILGHSIMPDGTIQGPHNPRLIEMARRALVAPLLVVSNTTEGQGYSPGLAAQILNNIELQKRLIESIVAELVAFHYYGVVMDFEMVAPRDYLDYANFLRAVSWRLRPLGYMVLLNLRVDILLERQTELANVLPRPLYNTVADRFIIQTSEWACSPQVSAAQIDQAQMAMDL